MTRRGERAAAATNPEGAVVAPIGPPAGAAPSAGLRYVAGFDGLRAIAVLIVLASHVGYGGIVPGGFGVTIFFVISGFLIATLVMNEADAMGSIDLGAFYARRSLRLYPELLGFVAVCIASAPLLGVQASTAEKLAAAFYFMNYYYLVAGIGHPIATSYPWGHLWSLAVEEQFYLIFPGMMLLAGRSGRRRTGAILALVLVPLVVRFVANDIVGADWRYSYVATEARIDSIAWGCLLALALRDRGGLRADVSGFWLIRPCIVIVSAALLIATMLVRDDDFRWVWRFSVQGAALAALFANLLFDPKWRAIVAMLEWRPLRFVGRVSYGLYLYQLLVVQLLGRFAPGLAPPLLLPAAFAGSLAAATLSWRLLERPFAGLRRRLGSRRA